LRHSAVSAFVARHCGNVPVDAVIITESECGDIELRAFIEADGAHKVACGGENRSAPHHRRHARLRFETTMQQWVMP
jgi:hypothetical protein